MNYYALKNGEYIPVTKVKCLAKNKLNTALHLLSNVGTLKKVYALGYHAPKRVMTFFLPI